MTGARLIWACGVAWLALGVACGSSDSETTSTGGSPGQAAGGSSGETSTGGASKSEAGAGGASTAAGGAQSTEAGAPNADAGGAGAGIGGVAGSGGAAAGGASPGGASQGGGAGGEDPMTGGASSISCAGEDLLSVLSAHALDLENTASLLAGHPSEREATNFLLAPGLTGPPALAASFANLFETCTMALEYQEYCDGELCSLLACTGEGAGWRATTRLEHPVTLDEFEFEDVRVTTEWSEGSSGITFSIAVTATGPNDVDWSLTGTGAMDTDSFEVSETFEGLLPGGRTRFEARGSSDTLTGSLIFEGTTIAEFEDEHLLPSAACP